MRLLPSPSSIFKSTAAAGLAAAGAAAVGAIAVGAVAIGAIAVGKIAIGKLKLKLGHFDTLHVGELTVDYLIVHNRTDGSTASALSASPGTVP
jgi:hypothetical protein